jgi:hypothetical protein
MVLWFHSDASQAHLGGLVSREHLCSKGALEEWTLPSREEVSAPRDGYIISFVRFHERGLAPPPHPFFHGLLHHCWVELQHLNPNRIQHIAAFIALCEAYLGIKPHFKLWKYFSVVSLHKMRAGPESIFVGLRLVSTWK